MPMRQVLGRAGLVISAVGAVSLPQDLTTWLSRLDSLWQMAKSNPLSAAAIVVGLALFLWSERDAIRRYFKPPPATTPTTAQTTGDLRRLAHDWLDADLGFVVETISRQQLLNRLREKHSDLEPPDFQLDAELYAPTPDGRRGEKVFVLSVSKRVQQDWLVLGVTWSMADSLATAFKTLSLTERMRVTNQCVIALATMGVRSTGVGALADPAATVAVALEERIYLDEPVTKRRFFEAVQRLRFGFVALANTVGVAGGVAAIELPAPDQQSTLDTSKGQP